MNCHLTLTKRTETGKGAARQLRREGKIPAVLYGKGTTISLTLDPAEFGIVLRAKQQGHALITLAEANTKGASEHKAILQEVQYDPIDGHVLHADFFEVAMDQPIRVTIPIVITGSIPVGVTLGGVLRQRQRHLLVEGLPASIPDTVVIDASGLDIGQAVQVKDIPLVEGITTHDTLEKIVINILAKKKATEVAESESAEATENAPQASSS